MTFSSVDLIQYALTKQVPDIACHAVFETNYGQLALDYDELPEGRGASAAVATREAAQGSEIRAIAALS